MKRPVFLLKSRLSSYGGLEKQAWRIAKAFASKSVPVTILTSENTPSPHSDISIVFESCHHSLSYKKIQKFDQFCLRTAPKEALIFGLDRNSFQTHLRAGNGVHAAFLRRRHLFDSWHKLLLSPYNPLNQTILNIEKKAFEHPQLEVLFTNSHMVKEEINAYYRVDAKKIKVIHNGVEWNELQSDYDLWPERKLSLVNHLKLDLSSFHFLFIGNGFKRKGLDVLLNAFALLKEDAHLHVIGTEKNLNAYLALRDKLNLTRRVHFYGHTAVNPFYQLADALVIPSFYDPFANVTVEALAMGLYVVSSPFNGGSEVLTPETGFIVPSLLEPDAMLEGLRTALKKPKTWNQSNFIRQSAASLDFSFQMETLLSHV